MANAEVEARWAHIRAVTVTAVAAFAGILAAVLSAVLTADLPPSEAAADLTAISMLLLAVIVQLPLYRALGFEEFGGGKDVVYVAFMTFALWFITYGIILTTGAQFT